MLIKPADLQTLRTAINAVQSRSPAAAGEYQRAGHSHKRFRWDLLYASGLRIGDGRGMLGDIDLYAYMTDAHIDTALRSIVGDSY